MNSFDLGSDKITFEFTTIPLNHYFLQSSTTLAEESWNAESFEMIGDGSPAQLVLEKGEEPRKFFRVLTTVDTEEAPEGLEPE